MQNIEDATGKQQTNLSMAYTDAESDLQNQTFEVDYNETYLRERESDIQEVRRLAHEINLTAQFQARKIQEASEDIVIIADSTEKTEALTEAGKRNIDEALKNQKKMTTRNLICLITIIVICAVVLGIVISSDS